MKLALVDGTNAVMRRAMVQKDISKEQIVSGTVLNILDFVFAVEATHLVVAFDSKDSLRKDQNEAYKGDRTVNTGPWAAALLNALAQRNVQCVGAPGYEADDVIASYVARVSSRCEVVTLSSDHDLLRLAVNASTDIPFRVTCAQYKKGGGFEVYMADEIAEASPVPQRFMPLYHALLGGKNGAPGVPGIGKKKAGALVTGDRFALYQALTDEQRVMVDEWTALLELFSDAPVPELAPKQCAVGKIRA